MTNRYLLEIGTEELPVGFLKDAIGELKAKVEDALSEQRIPAQSVEVLATPRRLALFIDGLPEQQAGAETVHKGPPTRIAVDANGKPLPPGIGFAKKVNQPFSSLKQEEIDGETYLTFHESIEGRPSAEVLSDILPRIVLGLSGSHFMRWGNGTVSFSRPVRWMVSLWNKTHCPMAIENLQSGLVSQGHRMLASGPVTVSDVDSYTETLKTQGKVLVDHTQRRELVWQLLLDKAAELGGTVPENPDLLDTVTMLVEYPFIVAGQFDERFLTLPEEVIITVMAAHQKYFPVRDKASGKLMPYFLAVSNGRPEAAETIRLGNQKVLTARLEDAAFFFAEDQKASLADRVDALAGITFQKGLGTMKDKTHRLVALVQAVGQALKLEPQQIQQAERAAMLCKADLLTGMVRELTELQGTMGRVYAAINGEAIAVSAAIEAHYLPRFTGDALATEPVSIALSLADKIDTMVTVFAQKNAKLPTGSKDPLGLRRLSIGLLQTVFENKLALDIEALMQRAYELAKSSEFAGNLNPAYDEVYGLMEGFVIQRLKGLLMEQGYRYDVVDAVLEAEPPLKALHRISERLSALDALLKNPAQLTAIHEPANRIARILGDAASTDVTADSVQDSLFKADIERELHQAVVKLLPIASLDGLVSALEAISPTVQQYFDQVLVNDADPAVRQNRYNSLGLLHRSYLRLGRLTRMVL